MAHKQPPEHRPRDLPLGVAFDGMMASDRQFVRTKPFVAVGLLGIVVIYCFLMFAFATTNEDYFLWAIAAWSFAVIVWLVSYTVRLWRDFFRHQKRADEELGSRKRNDERKKVPIVSHSKQDLDVLKAEAKQPGAGDQQSTK